MANSRERAATLLQGSDGDSIWLALEAHASKVARRYGWRSDKTLPQGFSPQGVARDVIVKVLQGVRVWDESKEPSLLIALKGMVRSEIGHLYDDSEATRTEAIDRTLPDGKNRTADDLRGSVLTPEQVLLKKEQTALEATALTLILQEVTGNSELESVFLALYESASLKDVAQQTGLPIERIYSLRRELDRIAAKITPARVARKARERSSRESRRQTSP